ncbi:phage tail assembly protein [Dickeya dadantii]|uniref:phage tail assembly protein n=1 Tax=Dickeya dadantii TaxID=204038 RepID=UPI0014954FAF|nr:phage tail assembly protein [Dickeya dadantii]NPE59287.1 phage tail assembly protein [Dickeya dadantii]NPE70325.1 phage tail assembly protein [Dickeya dadantii]
MTDVSTDKTDVFTLSVPYTTAAGATIETITLQRLRVKDLKAIRRISEKPGDWDDLLLARSAGLVPEDLDSMDLGDYLELQKRFQKITGVVAPSESDDRRTGDAGEMVAVAAE